MCTLLAAAFKFADLDVDRVQKVIRVGMFQHGLSRLSEPQLVMLKTLKEWSVCYLGNDAAELRSILRQGKQVANGTANSVNTVGRLNLFDQDLQER